MKHRIAAALLPLALGLAACGEPDSAAGDTAAVDAVAAPPADAWITLFDGTGLDAFDRVGDANWTLDDGWVGADDGSGFLVSRAEYADFELALEFWVDVPANSGVFVRCREPARIGADNCYEINIFDTRPDPAYRTGGIVDVAEPAAEVHTAGRWNAYEITAEGPRLTVTLNGVETIDIEDARFASGAVALQRGAGRVLFRNVRIRPR